MKKIIGLLSILYLMLTINVSAQNKTVTSDLVYTTFGNAADTVIKNGTTSYIVYVKDWSEYVKFRPTLVRTRGTYTKARVIIQTSLDNTTYVAKDTVSFAGTGATQTGLSDLINCKDPYIKIITAPYDSTQTVKYKYTVLIDKND
jgi:hypothetical protein